MRFTRAARPQPEINLTSMIDILFIVLMFLLLTTTFKGATFIRVMLPEAATGERGPAEERTRVRIVAAADGSLYLDGRAVTLAGLREALAGMGEPDRVDVLLTADAGLAHGRIVAIMDLLRSAGVFRLGIETVPAGPEAAR